MSEMDVVVESGWMLPLHVRLPSQQPPHARATAVITLWQARARL